MSFDITQIPVYFAIAGFFLWALIERWFHVSGQQQDRRAQKDKGTYWLISALWYLTMTLSILDRLYFQWSPQDPAIGGLRWLGIPMISIGLVVRVMARRALGQHYSALVETSESHQLITDGIYCKLRHPAYFGLLNLWIGIPLGLWSLTGLAISLIGGIPAILYRIRIEEETLSERFGKEYQEYAQDTWKLLPYLW